MVTALTPEEARRFLDATRFDRLSALYAVALAVGLRQGEALALGWDSVDLEARTLVVRRALQFDGKLQFVEPKTSRSRRTVTLPSTILGELRAHRLRQLEERLWAGSRWQEHGLIFTTTVGTPLDGSNVTHRLQAILERAGLARMRFHDLRHGAASLLLAQGVSPRVVMEILGHSQISLILNTYSHVIPHCRTRQRIRWTRSSRALSGPSRADELGPTSHGRNRPARASGAAPLP